MFAVAIMMAGATAEVGLFFETQNGADAAADLIYAAEPHAALAVADDKGHSIRLIPRNVIFVRVSDMARDIANQADLALLQHREQAKLQQRASQDPALMLLSGGAGIVGQQGGRRLS